LHIASFLLLEMDHTPDNAAQAVKQEELKELLNTFVETRAPHSTEKIERLIGSFIALRPPLDPPLEIKLIVMSDLGQGGAKSRKPGNITLNWRRLFELIPDVTIAGASAAESMWLIPFAALYVWMKLWKAAAVNIEERDAFVLYSLWLNRNERKRIAEDEAFSMTKSLAEKHDLPAITKKNFAQAIDKLLSLDCIEIDEGVIWLREWVRVTY
jgi:hypothetical protein